MNLATARSANRAKEVGLRKVVGALRSQLIGQFLSESILLAVTSLLLALIIVALSLGAFNEFAGKELAIDVIKDGSLLIGLIAITLFVGIVAGSYPALFLSAFQPVSVLSGTLKSRKKQCRAGVLAHCVGELGRRVRGDFCVLAGGQKARGLRSPLRYVC